MRKKILLLLFFGSVCIVASSANKGKKLNESFKNLTQYVDPTIGTGDHGHVFMGANVPYGEVQLGPTQFSQGWDWCSGYNASDSTIIGFGHIHLSGTGCGDLGDISFMPAVGDVKLTRGNLQDENSGIYSKFSHKTEVAKPGYYGVHLDRFNIDVALTATERVGFHRYTFPESNSAKVIIDLEHAVGGDPIDCYVTEENDSVVSGYRIAHGWADHKYVYFSAKFSKPIASFSVSEGMNAKEGNSLKGKNVYGVAHFSTKKGEQIYIKVGISAVSIDNAKLNMKTELPGWDFDKAVFAANANWDEALNKIVITTKDNSVKRTFYASLYHTMVAPSVFCDVNGDYRGSDGKIHRNANFTNYTTFSLWDTYRAAQPLMTLISPEMLPDIASTFIHIYKEQGKLPVWHLWGNETNCMVGNAGAIVLSDIMMKGADVDKDAAYDALKSSEMMDERGLKWKKEYGYIPWDKEDESVSKCLEFGIADWSIAQVAKKMGKTDDYNYFIKGSKAYKYYYNPETRFLQPKDSNGKFKEPFDPAAATDNGGIRDYTEGNGWQYTFLVPQDVNGLISLFGSDDAFGQRLDSLFLAQGNLGADAPPDISGMIGQYCQGNEPSHQAIYMYPFAGQQWKTAEKARIIMSTLYSDKPAGLSGNEDVGQMSAWYVLTAIGLYQVAPAGGDFIFGSPVVDKAVLKVGHNRLTIIAKNNSSANKYIQSVSLNGKPYSKSYISYKDLMAGGRLEFTMGSKPSQFGVKIADRPVSHD